MNRLMKMCVSLMVCAAVIVLQPLAARANPLDPYIQAAKKEGAVKIGVTLRSKVHGKPAGELYIKAFQKRYPFLKVDFKRIGGPRDRERIISEMVSGLVDWDVATLSETMIPTIMESKLTRILDWEKLGVNKVLTHPYNFGVYLRSMVFGIAYNRNLVSDEEARKFTWETCTDPKWKGKSGMHVRPRHLNRLVMEDAWGREKTLDYAKRWAANVPGIEHSRATAASKLTAGAYHIFCGETRDQVLDLQVFGEAKSIGIVFPEPVPVGLGELVFVPDKAKHPNAGILFLAWTGTREAQNILDQINFSGHPAFEGNEITEVLKGKQLSMATWKDSLHADEDLAEIVKAMGMPIVRTQTKKKK
ncbi:MAG: extracellular solute-binding protein [Desulfobacterales bacterium]|nr:extracellular solute-binding protein [Desulfobacterales bacterium]